MVAIAGTQIVGCWLGLIVASTGACKGGDAGTDSAETTSAASTSTSSTSTASTGSTGGSTSTTGVLPTGTNNTLTEAGENGPPCPQTEIMPAMLPIGTVDEPYMATVIHGVPSDVGEVVLIGMMPPGVEQSAGNGVINLTGTPTMAGEFPLTVSSSTGDGGTCLPEKDYLLVIADGAASTSGSTGTTGGSTGMTGG